jgi:hypothetical protein
VITVGKLPDDEDIRIFIHSKSNFSMPGSPQGFGFDGQRGIVWLGEADITLDELLDGELDEKKPKRREKSPSKRDNAKEFITANLAGNMTPPQS